MTDTRRLIKRSDTELSSPEFNLCYKYYKKYFQVSPQIKHLELFLLMKEIYNFEFNMWAKGNLLYSAFTKRNRNKHLRWLHRQLEHKGLSVEGSLLNHVNR